MKSIIVRFQTFFRYRDLFFQLISRDIKLKYRRSILGYIWSMLNPLLTMMVMYLVFSNLFKFDIPNFPVYLLIGNLLFLFMLSATTRSLSSVSDNAGLIKKIFVPKYIFTLAVVTSELITFLFSLGALVILLIAAKITLTWRFVFILIPIIQLYVFSLGMGLFLAQITVFFKDMVYIWSILSTAWMYLSAIFYPVSILPEWLHYAVIKYNPMYFYITLFRNFTIGTAGMGSLDLTIRGSIAALAALLIGLVSFDRAKKKFILYM